LIELTELILDQSQFLQRQLQQSPIYGMKIRPRTESGAQLVGRCAQALVRQCGQGRRIRLAVGECLEHAACVGTQQIGDETRELDVRFFEQRLQSVVELDAVARDLILASRNCAEQRVAVDRREVEDEVPVGNRLLPVRWHREILAAFDTRAAAREWLARAASVDPR
jgi:hypothetical protein